MSLQLQFGMTSDLHTDTLALLTASPWLAGDAALARTVLQHGRLQTFDAGQWVHGEGDSDTGLFVVIRGAVNLYAEAAGERDVLVGHAERGAAIGQSMQFGGGPRITTAVTVHPSVLLVVSDDALNRIARARPDIWKAVASVVHAQLRATVRSLADTTALPPLQRVAARLHQMARTGAAGRIVTLHLSQSALAEMTGLTRKTVNGALARLARMGLVETGYGHIVVRHLPSLARAAAS